MTSHYPERNQDHIRSQDQLADSLTLGLLVQEAGEFALNGQKEENGNTLTFQNNLRINDERRLYAAKYFQLDASDVPAGDKLGDIVICDVVQYKVTGEPVVDTPHLYTNYFMVNEVDEVSGAPSVKLGKRQYMCASSEVVEKIASSHLVADPTSEFESNTDLNAVTAHDAEQLIMLFINQSNQAA